MRIGIFSGSFDPVHNGHINLAESILRTSYLDEIWLMPSPQNPLKLNNPPVSFNHRYEMCRLVAEKFENIKVSDFEQQMPWPTYTYNTLINLKKEYPLHEFSLIIGSDNWLNFNSWKNYDNIINEFSIIIYPRPGYSDIDKIPQNITYLKDMPVTEISSTYIRKALRDGRDLQNLLDPDVINYIRMHKLYS